MRFAFIMSAKGREKRERMKMKGRRGEEMVSGNGGGKVEREDRWV